MAYRIFGQQGKEQGLQMARGRCDEDCMGNRADDLQRGCSPRMHWGGFAHRAGMADEFIFPGPSAPMNIAARDKILTSCRGLLEAPTSDRYPHVDHMRIPPEPLSRSHRVSVPLDQQTEFNSFVWAFSLQQSLRIVMFCTRMSCI